MERELTELEKGIIVKISQFELNFLKNKKGFLSRKAYPEQYEKIALNGEIGRFLFFRFIEEN